MATPCPRCGTVNQPTARFCKSCGLTLSSVTDPITAPKPAQPPQATPTPPNATVRCPNCGTQNRSTAHFCSNCRASLTQPVTPPVGNPPPPAATPPLPSPNAPLAGGATTIRLPATQPPKVGFRWLAIIPLAVLLLLLCGLCSSLYGVYYLDSTRPTPTLVAVVSTETPQPTETPESPTATFTPPPPPTTVEPPTRTPTATANPPFPVADIRMTGDGRFGFTTTEGDPANPNDNNKPLTYRKERQFMQADETPEAADGRTNNTRVSVDGATPLFGEENVGTWVTRSTSGGGPSQVTATWDYQNIRFTQTVGVVLSPAQNRFDTFRISYTAENLDTAPHQVGVRVMLDTLIGDNDGVPFNVPGDSGLTRAPRDLTGSEIPDFIEVYENDDLTDPGVIVRLTLKGGDATTPDRVLLASWCAANVSWDYLQEVGGLGDSFHQCGDKTRKLDSSVGIFWTPTTLGPGETRTWTTYYGLGKITTVSNTGTSAISLSELRKQYAIGEEFWISALVQNPQPGQSVRIALPPELQLMEGAAEQTITETQETLTQLSWRVKAIAPTLVAEIHMTLLPENQDQTIQTTIVEIPTATPTATRSPTNTRTPTITPTPCVTTVINTKCE